MKKMYEIFEKDNDAVGCNASPYLVSNTMVGIEHELEGYNEDIRVGGWKTEHDPSLRNGGIEFILDGPQGGARLATSIENMHNMIDRHPELIANERTSTHIHIDARDMTTRQLLNMIVVYTTFEHAIFAMCEQSRTDNNFCVPSYKNGGLTDRVRRAYLNPDSDSAVHALAHSNYRYAAMNLSALSRFGSIEFRMSGTLTDKDKLFDWINIFLSIKAFAVLLGEDDVQDTIARMSKMEAPRLTSFIFGEKITELFRDKVNIFQVVGEGLLLARHTYCSNVASDGAVCDYAQRCDVEASPILGAIESLTGGRTDFVNYMRGAG